MVETWLQDRKEGAFKKSHSFISLKTSVDETGCENFKALFAPLEFQTDLG